MGVLFTNKHNWGGTKCRKYDRIYIGAYSDIKYCSIQLPYKWFYYGCSVALSVLELWFMVDLTIGSGGLCVCGWILPVSAPRKSTLHPPRQTEVNEHQTGPTSKSSMQAMPCPICGSGLKMLRHQDGHGIWMLNFTEFPTGFQWEMNEKFTWMNGTCYWKLFMNYISQLYFTEIEWMGNYGVPAIWNLMGSQWILGKKPPVRVPREETQLPTIPFILFSLE